MASPAFAKHTFFCPVQSYRINPRYLYFGGVRLFEYLSESGKVGVYLQEGFTHLVLIVLKSGGCTHASLVDLMYGAESPTCFGSIDNQK